MGYCPDCGAEATQGRPYCANCGTQMEGAADPLHLVSAVTPSWPIGRKMALAGGLLAGVGVVLPLFSRGMLSGSQTVDGAVPGTGSQLLIAAGLLIAVSAWRWGRWQRAASGLFGCWILVDGAVHLYDRFWGVRVDVTVIQRLVENPGLPDVGLYLTVVAGLVVLAGILVDSYRR